MAWGSLQLVSPGEWRKSVVCFYTSCSWVTSVSCLNLLSLPLLCLPSFPCLTFLPSLPILLASSFYIKSKLLVMIAYFHLSFFTSWVPEYSTPFYRSVADIYTFQFTWLLGLHSLYLSLTEWNSVEIFFFHFRMRSPDTKVIAHCL